MSVIIEIEKLFSKYVCIKARAPKYILMSPQNYKKLCLELFKFNEKDFMKNGLPKEFKGIPIIISKFITKINVIGDIDIDIEDWGI